MKPGRFATLLAALILPLAASAHTVNTGPVNVRSGPGTTYSIVGTLQQGAYVEWTAVSGAWTKIDVPMVGWVYSTYLSDTPHGPLYQAAVTATSLNVYAGAGTTYAVRGKLTLDRIISVLEVKSGWSRFTYAGAAGWALSSYLRRVPEPLLRVRITTAQLNVRKGPGSTYALAGQVTGGAVVKVYAYSGSWYKIIFSGYYRWIVKTYSAIVSTDTAVSDRALRIHQEALVADTHSDTPTKILDAKLDIGILHTTGHMDLPRLRRGGANAQFLAAWVDPRYHPTPAAAMTRALAMMNATKAQVAKYPDQIALARTAAEARAIGASGKVAAILAVEGGYPVDSLAALGKLYDAGARYLTLTWMYNTTWADGSGDTPAHHGLTDFGREVVREMNRLGMIVDVSHVSEETFWDALAATNAPVLASHSCCKALRNHHRNLSDAQLLAVARNDGVVCINFFAQYLSATTPVPLDVLIDHIDRAVKIMGADHVGLGSDFDGVVGLPVGLSDCSYLPRVTQKLLDRGYAEADIKKILGGNVLRLMEKVEAARSAPPQ